MSGQVSRGSAGEYQTDERQVWRGSAGEYQADERAGVAENELHSKNTNTVY